MATTLFFAHSNGFPAGSYRRFLAPLGQRYAIQAPELLGHDPRYPVTQNWHHLVEQLLDELAKAPTPVIGVGHSLGGVLTFLAAIRAPEYFRAFIMLDPPAYFGPWERGIWLAKRLKAINRITPAAQAQRRRTQWPDRDTVLASFQSKGLFRSFDPQCLRDYVHAGTEPSADGVRLRYQPRIEAEVFRTIPHNLSRHPRVGVPGALVRARNSDIGRGQHLLCRRHGLLYRHTDGGHMFPLERPQAAAALVDELIGELVSGHEAAGVRESA